MSKKKIYIGGKVTGLPIKEVVLKFEKTAEKLEKNGFEVINPVQLVQEYIHKHTVNLALLSEESIWKMAMKECISKLIFCDAVLLLNDYHDSRGALIEQKLALDLGIPVFYDLKTLLQSWRSSQPIP